MGATRGGSRMAIKGGERWYGAGVCYGSLPCVGIESGINSPVQSAEGPGFGNA